MHHRIHHHSNSNNNRTLLPPAPAHSLLSAHYLSSHSLPQHILYLKHDQVQEPDNGDYIVDLLLHGLIDFLFDGSGQQPNGVTGPRLASWLDNEQQGNVIDVYPVRPRIFKQHPQMFDEAGYYHRHASCYGQGYTFAGRIDQYLSDEMNTSLSSSSSSSSSVYNYTEIISQRIQLHYYDVIIYASAHRNMAHFSRALWEKICLHYSRWEVAVIDGGDGDFNHDEAMMIFVKCSAYIFTREGHRKKK